MLLRKPESIFRPSPCSRPALLFFAAWLVAILLPTSASWGWIDTGHKIIAQMTWEELTPAARAKITALLKQHPRYEKDLLARLPEGADESATALHAFMVASTWPDLVRAQAHPMHYVAHHPDWHYIDIPYAVGGQPIPADGPAKTQPGSKAEAKPEVEGKSGPAIPTTQPAAAVAAAGAGHTVPHDVVEALTKNAADLREPGGAPADRAVALCWVLHLAGDIHQPLHACILFSPQFPKGDQGGNAILVLREPPYLNSQMNLHLLWDKLPGDYKDEHFDGYLAAGLRADPRFSRQRMKQALAVKDFNTWAQESHELAVKYAYLNGELKGALAHPPRTQPKEPIPGLPPGYLENAEEVAARQVVLAAYRTADLLNDLFGGQ